MRAIPSLSKDAPGSPISLQTGRMEVEVQTQLPACRLYNQRPKGIERGDGQSPILSSLPNIKEGICKTRHIPSNCYLGNFELKVINVWSIVENSLFKCAVTEGIEFPAIFLYNFLEIDQESDTLIR